MNAILLFFKENILCDIFLVLGVLAIYITYIGAPRASKKTGHFVSGIPAVGGLLIAIGFLTSSVKWLALTGLLEPGFLYFIFRVIPDIIQVELETRNYVPPSEMEGGKVIEYSSYKNRFDEIRTPHEEYEGTYHVQAIVRYIIIKRADAYQLLEQTMNTDIVRQTDHATIEDCKKAASSKAKWKTR